VQRTLAGSIAFDGTGLHTGRRVRVDVHPAAENEGLVFCRVDRADRPVIRAHIDNVVGATLATTLGVHDATVTTVEHLIAALHGMGVDNALVEVDGPEIPSVDGSARPFVDAIEGVGLARQTTPRRVIRVVETVEARDPENDRWCRLAPDEDYVIDCEISFPHPLLTEQRISFTFGPGPFATAIAPARTFGMLADVERMRAAGLALGGGLDNAVVFSATDVINPGGLRFPDECVRHKVLDMIGDLALLGRPVLGRFSAYRSGHAFNLALVRKALEQGALVHDEVPARSLSASG
jgi:UDP-3-O-[3-hydroxymyristoyl] N-acetylglucosamine deacetylase